MKIRTQYHGPLPEKLRDESWSAVDDDYEPGNCIGFGATEQHAINDLYRLLAERDEYLEDLQERRTS
ncbi:MAG: hypothetical protein ACM3IH_15000 [Sphingobacteriales bacterium]